MNSATFLGPFSLSTFPIGIGLTAAAHAHLCNRSLARTEEQRQQCNIHQALSKADYISQLLLDLNSVSEMLDLVDIVLMRIPEPHARHRRRHESRRLRPHHRDKGMDRSKAKERKTDTTKRNSNKKHHSHDNNDNDYSELHEAGYFGNEEVPTAASDETKQDSGSHHSRRTSSGHYGESSSSGTRRYSHPRQPQGIHRLNGNHPVYGLSVADLEQWSTTYKALRLAQEGYIKNTVLRIKKTEPFYFSLHNNLAFSLLLSSITMLRYVVSNERFCTFFSKYTSRLRRLLSLFKWGPLSPPNSLYIPWGLASSRSGQRMASASSSGPDTMTNTGQSSSVSVAFALLPLMPTLFVSGMHFFAAARAQWVVHRIQNENRTQTQFLRRLSVVSIFLSIREQRLAWLAQRIREFEDAELEKEDEEEYEDVGEDVNENDDGGDENNTGNGSEQTNRVCRPAVTTETRSESPVRPRYLAHDAHSRVYSMLQGERSNEWPHDQFQSLDNISNSNNGQDGTVPNHHSNPNINVRLFPLAFGPDLKNMDLTLFLNNPQERRRILRLEFEGMRDELTVFRDATVRSKY